MQSWQSRTPRMFQSKQGPWPVRTKHFKIPKNLYLYDDCSAIIVQRASLHLACVVIAGSGEADETDGTQFTDSWQ